MTKWGLLLAAALASTLLTTGSASAHVLIKDHLNGTGAILHLNPDDDPVAGERASLFFDIRDRSLTRGKAVAKLTITENTGATVTVRSERQGASVSANYVFPRQGLYQIKLVVEQNGKPIHEFLQSQRVSRGIIGSGRTPSAPAWAQAGIVFTVLTAVFVTIIAFNRRKAIMDYSKW